jgi:hypothetical protein
MPLFFSPPLFLLLLVMSIPLSVALSQSILHLFFFSFSPLLSAIIFPFSLLLAFLCPIYRTQESAFSFSFCPPHIVYTIDTHHLLIPHVQSCTIHVVSLVETEVVIMCSQYVDPWSSKCFLSR